MTPDFRALCAEILTLLDLYEDGERVDWDAWRARARALLAEPVAEGPSDAELRHLWLFNFSETNYFRFCDIARAVLARWGRPAAAPVPETGEVEGVTSQ